MRYFGLFVRIAVSTGLLLWILSGLDLAQLAGLVLQTHLSSLAAAVALYFIGVILVGAARWQLLLASQGVRVPFGYLVRSYLVASFFNNLLPTNIGGDVFRIKDAARYTASKTLSTAVVFVDRLIGFAALFAVALAAVALGGQMATGLPGLAWLWFGLAAVTVALLAVLAVPEVVEWTLLPLHRAGSEWVALRVGVLTTALFRFRREIPAVSKALLVSLFIQGSIVIFYFMIASGMGIPLPLVYCFIITPLVLIAQLFPSINGFGVRESAMVFFFKAIGLTPEQAVSLSFVSTALILLLSLAGGAIYATREV